MKSERFDVVVIGAGAAGMFCAAEAGRRGRSVLVVDHAARPGEKIRISGGGRCNFTNVNTSPKQFLSQNPHFCISALKHFPAQDFIRRVEARGIAFHEKAHGQLFCDGPAQQIVDMLVDDMVEAGIELRLSTRVHDIAKSHDGFLLGTEAGPVACSSLVVATGGKSIPKMGATGFGYRIAEQFGLTVTETRPALVPFTFEPMLLEQVRPLAGIATDGQVRCGSASFREAILFTHRGLSGPAILQISSHWREGDRIEVNLAANHDAFAHLRSFRSANGKQDAANAVAAILPKALAQFCCVRAGVSGRLADMSDVMLRALADCIHHWSVKPSGTEGFRTAEVTLGGISTGELDQRTMEARSVPGLFFIGEVVDVTGWLGGYNFQWAWSSAWVAGQTV